MTTHLSVNVNAIAQLRNRRDLPWPNVVHMARLALSSGAHGITVHPRPDQRHIRLTDVQALSAMLRSEYPEREFNIEGYPSEEFLALVENAAPQQVTLVPDDPAQATSDHGWNFAANAALLKIVVARLQDGGRRVSLFCDPDPALIADAKITGCDRIELYTGPYGATHSDAAAATQAIDTLAATVLAASEQGLGVNAGHDLTVANLPPLLAAAPGILEVSVGHALTADALEHGLARTVQRYLEACGSER